MAEANPSPAPPPAPAPSTQQPAPGTNANAQPPDAGLGGFLFPLAAMAILFWLFIIRPEKKRQKEKDAVLSSVKKNDRVVTIFGLYGTVVEFDGDDVVLNVDAKKDVKMRFRRVAIDSVVKEDEKK